MNLDITITAERITRRLAGWPARAEQALGGIVTRLGASYLDALKAATPRGKGEAGGRARLVDSYQTTASGLTYRITNRAPHLRYVLQGRPAVVAKKRALRFVIGGVVFFRRRVKAAPANNFPPVVRRQMAGEIRQARTDAARAVRRAF